MQVISNYKVSRLLWDTLYIPVILCNHVIYSPHADGQPEFCDDYDFNERHDDSNTSETLASRLLENNRDIFSPLAHAYVDQAMPSACHRHWYGTYNLLGFQSCGLDWIMG